MGCAFCPLIATIVHLFLVITGSPRDFNEDAPQQLPDDDDMPKGTQPHEEMDLGIILARLVFVVD